MENVGLITGSASLLLHLGQGFFHLLRHLKVSSNCCGKKSSFEIETGTPPLPPAKIIPPQ
jgi:hypothetical protein